MFLPRPHFRSMLLVAFLLSGAAAADAAEDFVARRASTVDYYRGELEKLADWCQQHELIDEAKQTAAWCPPRDPGRLYVFRVPEVEAEPPTFDLLDDEDATEADESLRQWQQRFLNLRRDQADALYELARRAADAGQEQLAGEMLLEALHEWPWHRQIRTLLGYVVADGVWVRAAAAKNRERGLVDHPRFGWIPAEDVARYEGGERKYRNRWVTADEANRRHKEINRGWKIETEHFSLTTNHSLEEGVRLLRQLEGLRHAWYFAFAEYHLKEGMLARRMKAVAENKIPPKGSSRSRRHKIVYFREREEYADKIGKMYPGAEATLGAYFSDTKTSYFFAGEEQDPGTVLHETTHQLFQESRTSKRRPGEADNFWIIEGVACYMESLTPGPVVRDLDGIERVAFDTLGGLDAGRVPAARVRLLEDSFYVPFGRFVQYSSAQLQQDPNIRTLYSQAAGQTAFLMHAGGGKYRAPLARYLQAVYGGKVKVETLLRLCNKRFATLDEEYRAYLEGE